MKRSAGTVHAAVAALALTLLSAGCGAVVSDRVALPNDAATRTVEVAVLGDALTLHLASPRVASSASSPAAGPLVLYASGDGGWFGAAVGMFHTLAATGFPVVGFSTKELMHIVHRRSRPPDVADVSAAYQQIIAGARTELRLPLETPIVLTGWSRGAALSVLVASRREADARIAGVVAIGLAADEHLEMEADSDDDLVPPGMEAIDPVAPAATARLARERSIALYPLLARLAPQRAVVVQASGDSYLPAARARELFGADSATSRLVTIDARNHRFSGGESRFAAALIDAVRWVVARGGSTIALPS